MRDRIVVSREKMPYQFEITLANRVFRLAFDYNGAAGLFTAALYDSGGALLCAGEPLMYGVPLFQDVYRAGAFPPVDIVPFDESGQEDRVTWENLGKTVFLTIDNEGA